jgi:hypothetical protein
MFRTSDEYACSAAPGPDITASNTGERYRGQMWVAGNGCQLTSFTTYIPPNDGLTRNHECFRHTWAGVYAARSKHPGGVNACLADASVRFVPATIDVFVWRAAGTRANGEPLQLP